MRRVPQDLLVEIGCEELPAQQLFAIQNAFAKSFGELLTAAEFTYENLSVFSTPRRLALVVEKLYRDNDTQLLIKRGPSKQAAFDTNGKPTKAALGFASSCGVTVNELSLQDHDKGAWLIYEEKRPAPSLDELLPELLEKVLTDLPVGKRMSLNHTQQTFSRPIHWIVLLLGRKTIPAEIFGIQADKYTYGHRFHHPKPIRITSPKTYEATLEKKGYVIPSFEKRRALIQSNAEKQASKHDAIPVIHSALLDEVTGLVEYPVLLVGNFNPDYLKIPKAILITSMESHQKCFALVNKHQRLLPTFLIVSNLKSRDPKQVIEGNERVIDARLADAAFYFDLDRKASFEDLREQLKNVRFQAKLGTLWDKTERIKSLATFIANAIQADPTQTERAAILCKNDLLTQVVYEFPELQGIMGHHYASGTETPLVAKAIEEHYYPRFANDQLPQTKEGIALALADRIDTLVGLFGIEQRPTGDKDPFSLRRQALGALRILIEKTIPLDLAACLEHSASLYGDKLSDKHVATNVMLFCFERLRAWYAEQGIPARTFEAVLANHPTSPLDFHKRLLAINSFVQFKEAEALAAANKRVKNILSKNPTEPPTDLTQALLPLQEDAEKQLVRCLSSKQLEVEQLLLNHEYESALKSLSTLEVPIDRFFSEVMIMTDDPNLRKARLALLQQLRSLFLQIADISLL